MYVPVIPFVQKCDSAFCPIWMAVEDIFSGCAQKKQVSDLISCNGLTNKPRCGYNKCRYFHSNEIFMSKKSRVFKSWDIEEYDGP